MKYIKAAESVRIIIFFYFGDSLFDKPRYLWPLLLEIDIILPFPPEVDGHLFVRKTSLRLICLSTVSDCEGDP